ncbi:MAG: hypothetical protein ACI4WP_00310 [Bacilli bacterium]
MDKKKEERVPIPLRIPKDLFKIIRRIVNSKKEDERGYSINKFVLEAIEEKVSKSSRSE